jgi:GntR family transcriptional regulator, transcriptional repressor for pyruvate dehydrogenase complex
MDDGKPSPFSFPIEQRVPLSVLVSRRIREAIVSGKVTMGSELPSEKELTRELGVGRSTVREALRILQAQGLLSGAETVSTKRLRVSKEHILTAAAVAMTAVLQLGQVPLTDLVELRLLIEGAAIENACKKPDEASLEQANQALQVMLAPEVSVEAFREADLKFHQNLVQASGNTAFLMVMGVLRKAILTHLGDALAREPHAAQTMGTLALEHQAILDAVTERKAKRARKLLMDHISNFYEEQRFP